MHSKRLKYPKNNCKMIPTILNLQFIKLPMVSSWSTMEPTSENQIHLTLYETFLRFVEIPKSIEPIGIYLRLCLKFQYVWNLRTTCQPSYGSSY